MITSPWDDSIPDHRWIEQPRFATLEGCKLRPVLGGYNDWKAVTLVPSSQKNLAQQHDEIQAVYDDILEEYETRALETITPDGFVAMDTCPENARDGYYLIKWEGSPYRFT